MPDINISGGGRSTLVYASFLKYALAHAAPTPAEQLETLEHIASLPFGDITTGAIAAIEPCSHAVAQMIMDALDLPPAQPHHKISAGWALLASEPTWSRLTALCPSLNTAANLCGWVRTEAAT
jgi:hypothetical protein